MKSTWASNSAVLWREIARTSRRWQTYLGRAAFSMALLGAILLGSYLSMEFRSVQDQSQNAQLARYLFISITVFQMLISLVMAPMVSAKAIIEERLDGTLDLLVLTPITAMRLLTSKVLSRVLVLLLIVLGSLPLLAQVVTLGGVSVIEVVLATLGNLVMIVVLGTLGGWFGLFTKSPIIATLASAGWALLAFLGLPGIYAAMAVRWQATAMVSPFFASLGDWGGLAMPL
ncbi:MAG: ABC-type transport system involved in multi-copper enzyme maturation permease subunit, partial [Kiritimatiellia bacterium]